MLWFFYGEAKNGSVEAKNGSVLENKALALLEDPNGIFVWKVEWRAQQDLNL